ncbi:hypothetical protein GGR53DRAFT_517871 [Hypoxylon sp. FL1150]|nr:hypothetical protein GGR53DRAFT_517871 [Hypoxylon sp. FL1150]
MVVLVDLAAGASARRSGGFKISFLIRHNTPHIPEERMEVKSALPNGYNQAKLVCERTLDETLHTLPNRFRPMVARAGQISGSSSSGYWNHMEHLSFLVAGTMADLLLGDVQPYPIYHMDSPVRQPWKEPIAVLADALDIPRNRIIPFKEWLRRVRDFPGAAKWDNPTWLLADFFELEFERMSCGRALMETVKAQEHSAVLRGVGPDSGFLR